MIISYKNEDIFSVLKYPLLDLYLSLSLPGFVLAFMQSGFNFSCPSPLLLRLIKRLPGFQIKNERQYSLYNLFVFQPLFVRISPIYLNIQCKQAI